MKKLLKEEIKRTLELMGILVENPTTTISLLKKVISKLIGAVPMEDVFQTIEKKIMVKLNQSISDVSWWSRSLNGIEEAVNKNILKDEEIFQIMYELSKKDSDEMADFLIKEIPELAIALPTAANKRTKMEALNTIPALRELPDDVVNSLLKKSGANYLNEVSFQELISTWKTRYPNLFKEKRFSDTLVYKENYDELTKRAVNSLSDQNMNVDVVQAQIEKLCDEINGEINKLIRDRKIAYQSGETFMGALNNLRKGIGNLLVPLKYKDDKNGVKIISGVKWGHLVSELFILAIIGGIVKATKEEKVGAAGYGTTKTVGEQVVGIFNAAKELILCIFGDCSSYESGKTEPVKPEPVKPEPVKPEPVKPELGKIDETTNGLNNYLLSLKNETGEPIYSQEEINTWDIKELEKGKFEITFPNRKKKTLTYNNGKYVF